MGMDVYGRDPSDEQGKYFRANIWYWPQVLSAIRATGTEVPDSWQFNDGQGYETQEECTALADKLDELVESDAALEIHMLPGAQALLSKIEGLQGFDEISSPGAEVFEEQGAAPMDKELITEFSKFLRSCGGFEIW